MEEGRDRHPLMNTVSKEHAPFVPKKKHTKSKPKTKSASRRIFERNTKTQGALLKSEEKYRNILENISEVYFELDLAGRLSFFNQNACKLMGYTEEELLGMHYTKYLGQADIERLDGILERIFRTGKPEEGIYWDFIRKDGSVVPVESSASIVYSDDGKPAGIRGIVRDITERKAAVEALSKSEEKYRTILDSIQDGYLEVGLDWKISFCNYWLPQMTGFTAGEIMGMDGKDLTSASGRKTIAEQFSRILQSGIPQKGIEFEMKRKDGSIFTVEASVSLMYDTLGNPVGWSGICRDMSERKAKENAQREREAAQAAAKAKSDFLAHMSHEIRTPMNGIIGMTGFLLETELDEDQREYAVMVRGSAEALLAIINDILDFSKIEAGKLDFEFINFDLRAMLDDVTDFLGFRAYEKGLELTCQIEPGVPEQVRGDHNRIRQIITNLVGNALKFTREGGVYITVSLVSEDAQQAMIRFEIRDTGIGIAPERLDKLFAEYSQADISISRVYGGTGLGLSISKRLCEMMQGSIGVESVKGEGTTFWFSLPLGKQKNIAQAEAEIEQTGIFKDKMILAAGQSDANSRILAGFLQTTGCRFEQARDKKSALGILQEAVKQRQPVHAVIIDMQLPGGDDELAAWIRSVPWLNPALLIRMIPMGLRAGAAQALHKGFDGQIKKPLKKQSVLAELTKKQTNMPAVGHQVSREPAGYSIPFKQKKKVSILLAEDNSINQLIALKMLEKLGYRADTVMNGREAIDALGRKAYDIVLMDIEMPEMGGLEATRSIRDPATPVLNHNVYIIAMTAHALKGDMERCLRAGMNGYIAKPIKFGELEAAIMHWAFPGNHISSEAVVEIKPHNPVFDREDFFQRMGGDEDIMRELIGIFWRILPASSTCWKMP